MKPVLKEKNHLKSIITLLKLFQIAYHLDKQALCTASETSFSLSCVCGVAASRCAIRISCLVDKDAASDCELASFDDRNRLHNFNKFFISDERTLGICY